LEAWNLIYDEYLNLYGLGKLNQRYFKAMQKRALNELDYIITGDRFNLTLAEMEERQLETMLNNGGQNMTVEQSLIHLSKWVGQWLNAKTLTAREYFDLIGEFEKFAKYENQLKTL
jgi:predicted HTH transcriptional regulator